MSPESHELLPESLTLTKKLEETDDVEFIKENLGRLLEQIESDLGVKFSPDSSSAYEKMRENGCLARVEKLSRVLEALELHHPMKISDETENHYANAVIPTPEGIKVAFAEGQAPGPIRTMVGFGKTIVGFKTDNLKVDEIDFDPNDHRGASERKYLCRHISGEVREEDFVSLVMRIPKNLIGPEYLTEEELAEDRTFIFRSVSFK
jgi:hypothetical protein